MPAFFDKPISRPSTSPLRRRDPTPPERLGGRPIRLVWAEIDTTGMRGVLDQPRLIELGLDATLRAALVDWQRYFDHHFSATEWDGWRPPETAGAYAERGHALRAQLERALPGTEIILNLWPVG